MQEFHINEWALLQRQYSLILDALQQLIIAENIDMEMPSFITRSRLTAAHQSACETIARQDAAARGNHQRAPIARKRRITNNNKENQPNHSKSQRALRSASPPPATAPAITPSAPLLPYFDHWPLSGDVGIAAHADITVADDEIISSLTMELIQAHHENKILSEQLAEIAHENEMLCARLAEFERSAADS